MIHTDISEDFSSLVDPRLLEDTAQKVLGQLLPDSEIDLSIVIDDDQTLQELNQKYLDIDAPTDVLSFQMNDLDPESRRVYLGDIIVSYPRAQAQAEAAGHPVDAELQLLVIHGILHLVGHDHSEIEEKKAMWQVQAKLLAELGVELKKLPED
jgi:probable rRNA maturation factor